MTCENLSPTDPTVPQYVAEIALEGIKAALAANGLTAIKRAYVGVGPVPAEDCCPDIVVWITNIRLWDGNAPDTLTENRVLDHFGLAFNVNARIGDCFWELDPATNKPFPHTEISKMSKKINDYGTAAYLGTIQALGEMDHCNVSVHPVTADPYQDGGCGGFIFTVGVSVV